MLTWLTKRSQNCYLFLIYLWWIFKRVNKFYFFYFLHNQFEIKGKENYNEISLDIKCFIQILNDLNFSVTYLLKSSAVNLIWFLRHFSQYDFRFQLKCDYWRSIWCRVIHEGHIPHAGHEYDMRQSLGNHVPSLSLNGAVSA